MALVLYNTLTQKLEEFHPLEKGQVKMYVCGPTVNDVPHLGHARQQITFDILRRVFLYDGYEVIYVSNITDIDDKIIAKAHELGEEIAALTKRNEAAHKADYAAVGVLDPTHQPHATEFITEMIALVQRLEAKGYTYIIAGDGVYFDIAKFKEYGKLSHQDVTQLKTGTRLKVKEAKRNKEDFVLWKFAKPGEPSWESPWGGGRPGWHIECSAMSHALLGLPFDIHGGGQDLIFPHHEDEIAQSEAAFGVHCARFWIHNAMVNVEKVKMSKSLGNFKTIRDLLQKYQGGVIRYFVLGTHYRKPVDFSSDHLDAAKNAFERLERKIIALRQDHTPEHDDETTMYDSQFRDALHADLNTPGALQVVWAVLDDPEFTAGKKLALLEKFDLVLGLGITDMREKKITIPQNVHDLVAEREAHRKAKKWKESDAVREKITKAGYAVEDTPTGPVITKL